MDIFKFKNTLQKFRLPNHCFEELPPSPAGNYVSVKVHNNLAFISGQMPFIGKGKLYPSQNEFENDEIRIGYIASHIAMMNALLQLADHKLITHINGIIKIEGVYNTSVNSVNLPKILDGASNLIANIFPNNINHARTVYGVNKLPYDAIVELSVIAEIITNPIK